MIDLTTLVTGELLTKVFGVLMIILCSFYAFYAFLMTRQVSNMIKSFTTNAGGFFRLAAYIHFLGAIVVLLIALTLLI
ncbi:MAG: DUF5657 family protein [Patescibacteria group bacterium]